jgi:SAM-dependent methyltransferase
LKISLQRWYIERGQVNFAGPDRPESGMIMKKKFTFLSITTILAAIGIGIFIGSQFHAIRTGLSLSPKPGSSQLGGPLKIKTAGKHRESALAHKLLDGLRGLEIGGGAHNPFGLKTLNVDYTDDYTTVFKKAEVSQCGEYMKVDVVSSGDDLPFKDNTIDFVVSSHVIEHFYDPVKAVEEWLRVVKPGGYVYIIGPHKERTFDKDKPRTPLAEIINRHEHPNPPKIDPHGHYSFWITEDFVRICKHYGWKIAAVQNVDDKVGNGFAVVIQKEGKLAH